MKRSASAPTGRAIAPVLLETPEDHPRSAHIDISLPAIGFKICPQIEVVGGAEARRGDEGPRGRITDVVLGIWRMIGPDRARRAPSGARGRRAVRESASRSSSSMRRLLISGRNSL